MRNKLLVVASLFIIASMVLGACATPPPQKVVETVIVEKEGQTIVVTPTAPPGKEWMSKDPTVYTTATFGDMETLDPSLCYETAGGTVIQNTYDTLIFYNKEDPVSYVPWLATEVPSVENGGISADGMNYTFKIRPGVKFHDGTEMTPEDVAYSIQRGLLQGGTSSPQFLLVEPFFGVGYDDIAAIAGEKVAEAWGVKVDELVAALDLAAVKEEAVKTLVADATAAHTAVSGMEITAGEFDAAAFLKDTFAVAADDAAKVEALKTFAMDTVSGFEGADVSALYDNREGMRMVDPAVLADVAAMTMEKFVVDPAAGTVTMKLATAWGPFLGTLANSWGAVQSKAWVAPMAVGMAIRRPGRISTP